MAWSRVKFSTAASESQKGACARGLPNHDVSHVRGLDLAGADHFQPARRHQVALYFEVRWLIFNAAAEVADCLTFVRARKSGIDSREREFAIDATGNRILGDFRVPVMIQCSRRTVRTSGDLP